MKMKMKNRPHRYDINRSSSRHGHKNSNYKNCLLMITLIYIKQHLRIIWSSNHEKLRNSEAELRNSVAHKKSV